MLQSDAAHAVGQRQQRIVMIEVPAAEQRDGFVGQLLKRCEVGRRKRELFGLVRHHRQVDRMAQVPALGVDAREHRRIDQRGVIDRAPAHAGAIQLLAIKRGEWRPASGEGDGGCKSDLPHVMPGGIKAHLFPLQVEHFGSHRHAAFGGQQRRGMDEARFDRARSIRQFKVECKGIDRVARPDDRLAARGKVQIADQRNRAGGAMVAGQPLGQQQRKLARARFGRTKFNGNRLGHAIDRAGDVAGVDR